MKQRITYILQNAGGVDPDTIEVSKDSVKLPGIHAAKEWRVTASTRELPSEISDVLKQAHEIHIRWTAEWNYDAVSPLSSRTPSGLHVFYTPRKDITEDNLCPLLGKIFGDGVGCASVKQSFSSPPILSERFSMSSAYQYYKPLARLDTLRSYLGSAICSSDDRTCHDQLESLKHASSVDLDYDTISHALKITAYWDFAVGVDSKPTVWDETLRLHAKTDSIEVGILNVEKATEPEEISLSGFLTVIGEDTKPSATLFSFPSRHHTISKDLPQPNFKTKFSEPVGLHPTLELTFPGETLTPPDESCALHTYLTLPSSVFIDRYQLTDPLFLESQNLVALRALSGATDLEAPVWATPQWGSASLFELAYPSHTTAENWTVTIPLHSRYLHPSDTGNSTAAIPWPAVFWACEAEDGLKMGVNPFDRTNIGYDGLFGPKTLFYHVGADAAAKNTVELLKVPVLDVTKTAYVERGTAIAVVLGFVWVLWSLFRYSGVKSEAEEKEEERKRQ